jgi:hypothetical protein
MSQFEWISFAEQESSTAQNFLGFLGNVLGLFFFLSPVIKMYELINEKIDHTRIAYLQYVSTIMNTLLWFVYGIRRGVLALWFCNLIGLIANVLYLTVYLYYYSDKNQQIFQQHALKTNGILFLIFVIFMWVFESYEIAGNCAMIFNIALYATPGQKIVIFYLFKLV